MHLRLRKVKYRDKWYIYEWMKNPDIAQFFQFDSACISIKQIESFITKAQVFAGNRHYAIVDDEDEYLGTVSLKNIDTRNRKCELAIALRVKHIGKGVGAFGVAEALRIAFSEMMLHKVYLNVFKHNLRAIRLYEKFGFKLEGESIDAILKNGDYLTLLWYSKIADNK